MKFSRLGKWIITISLPFFFAGCATDLYDSNENSIDTQHNEAQELFNSQKKDNPDFIPSSRPFIENHTGIWLKSRPFREKDSQQKLRDLGNIKVTINRTFKSPLEIAERVTALTGYLVTVDPDVYSANPQRQVSTSKSKSDDKNKESASPQPVSTSGISPLLKDLTVHLSYDGSLADFLDVACSRYGIAWKYNAKNREINLFRYATRSFRIHALPGETTLENTISNETGSDDDSSSSTSGTSTTNEASSTGGSKSKAETTIDKMSIWEDLEKTITNMLSPEGKVTVSPALGTVTVTDIPQVLDRIEEYVDKTNNSLSKQVTINVKVLAVELNDSDEYGINWDLMWTSVSNSLSLGFTSAFTTVMDGATKIGGSVIPGGGSPWANSQAVLNALSKQGKLSQITSASITTLNNQPAPLQVGNQTSYLASSSSTLTADVGSTTSLQPGLVTTGFSMSLIPHLTGRGQIMLQFSINLSSLVDMQTVNSGDSAIQAPQISTKNTQQRVKIFRGETLVLTGFEENALTANTQGLGDANNTLLGGGIYGDKKRTILVILIQPV